MNKHMKLQGFAMSYTKWDAIKHLFAPKAKVKDVIDSYDLVNGRNINKWGGLCRKHTTKQSARGGTN